jgi:branched-subunit amino acid aminotransferase/4-amino-4-deoxychorismate lyase
MKGVETLRCHRTAALLPAVFRLDLHLEALQRRTGARLDAPQLAQRILQAVETSGYSDASVRVDVGEGEPSITVTRPDGPVDAEPALFFARGGRLYGAAQREPSVIRDTMMELTGAEPYPRRHPDGEVDEAFTVDTVRGVTALTEAGPLTRRAQTLLRRAARGELPGYEHWLAYVGRTLVV